MAVAAFDDAGESRYPGAKVPIEQEDLHYSSGDANWRSSVLSGELMTGAQTHWLYFPHALALSAVTVQALADLGYEVDVTQADAFSVAEAALDPPPRAVGGMGAAASPAVAPLPPLGPAHSRSGFPTGIGHLEIMHVPTSGGVHPQERRIGGAGRVVRTLGD